jgi:hypothetical protein
VTGSRLTRLALGIAGSFFALVGVVVGLAFAAVVTPQMALLMMMALAGLYVGLGILVLARRLVDKLD